MKHGVTLQHDIVCGRVIAPETNKAQSQSWSLLNQIKIIGHSTGIQIALPKTGKRNTRAEGGRAYMLRRWISNIDNVEVRLVEEERCGERNLSPVGRIILPLTRIRDTREKYLHFTLCTKHYALNTIHYALCTMHFVQCTMLDKN